MKIANLAGRAVAICEEGAIDLARASAGRIDPDPSLLYARWPEVRALELDPTTAVAFDPKELGPPSPRPGQVFAIGLNYGSHAAESNMAVPEVPATFTKYPSSLTGPFAEVPLRGAAVDWEVEIVAVVGAHADRVDEADAWGVIAGLTVGQDYSDRHVQFAAGGQFSLGKSFWGYGPTGPWLVTPEEFADPDDLELWCSVNGVEMQRERSADLIFSIPRLIAELSKITPLWPGDLLFTGTPAGIGATRQPPIFLRPGDVVESGVEGIGTISNTMVAAS